eukprot:Pgem_evm1s17598
MLCLLASSICIISYGKFDLFAGVVQLHLRMKTRVSITFRETLSDNICKCDFPEYCESQVTNPKAAKERMANNNKNGTQK